MTEVKVAAVIGAGTMGPGIAAVLARRGCEVRLNDVSQDVLDKAGPALGIAAQVLDRLDAPAQPGGTVTLVPDLQVAATSAQLIIEAVPERLELKREVFARLEDITEAGTIFATNTSGIPVTRIAADLRHPERVIGMHWSNPPHLIPMIEVIPGERTSQDVRDQMIDLIKSFGYEAVVEKEVPGFVENRILYAILRECLDLVERGIISQADMDTCVRWGIGYKLAVIGPMRLLDMAGLDIYDSVATYLNPDLSAAAGVSSFIKERTAVNRLGMKTLAGIYDYTPDEVAQRRAGIAAGLVAVRKALTQQ